VIDGQGQTGFREKESRIGRACWTDRERVEGEGEQDGRGGGMGAGLVV
jgi:hypothetical protein